MNTYIEDLIRKAENGEPEAQHDLAVEYAQGEEIEQDFEESRRWYEKSASQGDFGAMYNLGTMFLDGQGGEKNIEKAFEYLELATKATKYDLGALAAAKLLNDFYENGYLGVTTSSKKAEEFARIHKKQNQLFEDEYKEDLP